MTMQPIHGEQARVLAQLFDLNPVGTVELSDDDLELCVGGTAYAGKRSPGCITMLGGECCDAQYSTDS